MNHDVILKDRLDELRKAGQYREPGSTENS
jgi:hypothetical protein